MATASPSQPGVAVVRFLRVACCLASCFCHSLGLGAGRVLMEDGTDLVQSSAQVHLAAFRSQGVDLMSLPWSSPAQYCEYFPAMCQEPLSCDLDPVKQWEIDLWSGVSAATPDGRANLRIWCLNPMESGLAQSCIIDRNLSRFAEKRYRNLMRDKTEVDQAITQQANYAFCKNEGLCEPNLLSKNATVEEMETFCDGKYPTWKSQVYPHAVEEPPSSVLAARFCAFGRFHCEYIHCVEQVCSHEVKSTSDLAWTNEKSTAQSKAEDEEAQ